MQLLFWENIKVSLVSIKSHMLRTVLTILIIAIGITALVGILTAIDAVKESIHANFSSMGSDTFKIRNRGMVIHVGKGGKRPKRYKPISYDEAMRFKVGFKNNSITSVSAIATWIATLKYKSKKSNPNIGVVGSDENYLITTGYNLDVGRNFSLHEVETGSNMVLLGPELAKNLFVKNHEAINKVIAIGNGKYRVIGVLEEKGSSKGFGADKFCIIPLKNVKKHSKRRNISYVISVFTRGPEWLDPTIGEATGFFRTIRKVPLKEENNFEIIRSDNLAQMLIENIKYVTIAATIIGIITLFGAAIGLMNIMLVSVTERTREIGIRKAMGATQKAIKWQFLMEAIVICQLGGLLGILLGILAGNLMSLIVGGEFIIPWLWITIGIGLCIGVGLASGIYPASKAAKLDPIESLRYE
jgi:putative ABC transport system permease protein